MSNHRYIIDKYTVELCELTHCNDVLMAKCTARDVFTRAEKDEIEIEKIMFRRNRTFYETMWRKDETMFQTLLEIMKEMSTAQSGDVLKILEGNQAPQSSQNLVEPEEKNIWFNVNDPTTSFVGREKELKELHEIVTRNADKDTQVSVMSQLTSVSGMGGIGKTTLAREYAKRYASFFNNNIIWINAETTGSTEESFRKLADKIGHNKIMENQEEKEVPISKVTTDTYEYLSRRKCLFVFDNVEEYKSTVAAFIPKSYEPGKIRPYILMTSRKQRLVYDSSVLSLNILAIKDAEKFITSKLQDCIGQIEEESVRKLAYELQCLPLALQQAVSYIQNQIRLNSFFKGKERNPIEEYLKLLEENPRVPLNHEYQDDTMDDYEYTVMRTWDVTLKAIEKEEYGNEAIKILKMLAYYPPENIKIQEFKFALSKEILQQSCVILEQYSMINQVRECINIHRVVQQVIRVQNKERGLEEYNLGRCLSVSTKYAEWHDIDQCWDDPDWDLDNWAIVFCFQNLVKRFRSILGKKFLSTNTTTDMEILNSALEILEKNETSDELIFLYCLFITSTFHRCEEEYDQDCLAQKAMTRLNSLIGMGHHHALCNIVGFAFSWTRCNPNPVIFTSKFGREVINVISKYCYDHSAEFLHIREIPYHLVQLRVKVRQLKENVKCILNFYVQ